MKMNPDDQKLAVLLASWRLQPTVNAGFRPGVWARIEGLRREARWSGYVRAHAAGCAALLVVVVGLGAWTGRESAKARVQAERAALVTSYVQGLDARAMLRP